MNAASSYAQQAHPAVRAYAQANGIEADAFRSGGRLILTIDERDTLHVWPASDGRVAIEGVLVELSELAPSAAEGLVTRLGAHALARFRRDASALAIDERTQQLCLQQVLPAPVTPEGLSQAMSDFLEAFQAWQAVVEREQAGVGV